MRDFATQALAVLLACAAAPAFASPLAISLTGQLGNVGSLLGLKDGDLVPNRYIVRLKPGIKAELHLDWLHALHKRSATCNGTSGLKSTFGFGNFNGYVGEFDDNMITQILANVNVLDVEQDQVAYLSSSLMHQDNAPWGLVSLSSLTEPSENKYPDYPSLKYSYDSTAGEGTYGYVLDSGVFEHNDFGGRIIRGFNAWNDTEDFDDYYGHGTHVAGTMASTTYGVAKKATIVDVKVARTEGYSTVSRALAGFDWAVNNITNTPGRAAKSVINMSLAFKISRSLNSAIDAATDIGILTVASAGNDAGPAADRSPGSAKSALTVGAACQNLTRAIFSNYGDDVDVFAPGVDVTSLWNKQDRGAVLSGTSMAAPHVAGLALYLKGLENNPPVTPAETISRVQELAAGVVRDAGSGSKNLLAYNGVRVL